MEIDKILVAREEKARKIEGFVKDNYQVVCLKANIPGTDKNIIESYVLVNLFDKKIQKLNPIKTLFYESDDGPYYIYLFDNDKAKKDDLIYLEENSSLGRLVDIDCFFKSSVSLSRGKLRKCFLCGNDAFVCIRNSTHSKEQLINFIKDSVRNYLTTLLSSLLKQALYGELNLEDKFGLVTPSSSGSHKDMNYELMEKAIVAIIPGLIEMFYVGYDNQNIDLNELFIKSKEVGKKVDEIMFKTTNNVNCYQGVIFSLGIVLTSIGYNIKNPSLDLIFDTIKEMVKDNPVSYGAIGQAKQGYKDVVYIINKYDLDDEESKHKALIELIIRVDDTILERRVKSKDEILTLKESFKNLLSSYDRKSINQLNSHCINNSYSFGGCADLLVLSIFLRRFSSKYIKTNN